MTGRNNEVAMDAKLRDIMGDNVCDHIDRLQRINKAQRRSRRTCLSSTMFAVFVATLTGVSSLAGCAPDITAPQPVSTSFGHSLTFADLVALSTGKGGQPVPPDSPTNPLLAPFPSAP
jgi:hypothetical protein